MCAAHSSVNMGENSSVLELLTCLNDHFVDMFCEKYVEIFTHTKEEIVTSLIKKDKEQLNLLRTRMLVHLVEQFPQFAGRGIVTRRKKSLLADDIYIIGYCIVSKMIDRRLPNIFKSDQNDEPLLLDTTENSETDLAGLIQNCAKVQDTTDNLKNTVNDLLARIFSLENEVTELKKTVKKLSEIKESKGTESKDKDVVIIDDHITGEQSRESENFSVNSNSMIKKNQIIVQAEVHADKNVNLCKPIQPNRFQHQRSERRRIQRGRIDHSSVKETTTQDKPIRIHAASSSTERYLVYIGRLDVNTKEEDLRTHILDIGLQTGDVADVIKLRCRNPKESSFCVSLNDHIAETVLLSTGQWPRGTRVRPYESRRYKRESNTLQPTLRHQTRAPRFERQNKPSNPRLYASRQNFTPY